MVEERLGMMDDRRDGLYVIAEEVADSNDLSSNLPFRAQFGVRDGTYIFNVVFGSARRLPAERLSTPTPSPHDPRVAYWTSDYLVVSRQINNRLCRDLPPRP